MLRRIVYLVGAGPGAPDLISARGLRCLQAADVVIYDHLVHARLLNLAPAAAERIDVGSAAPERLDQEAICYLIAEKAREHKLIVRLKWGDPFVFDQGGVEALFLHEQAIPFEVVPGVPAAVGVPAYAGIPITYPGGGDTLTFVRGYEDEGRGQPNVDWAALAKLEGTIVSFAGPRQLIAVIDALHGARPAAGRIGGHHHQWHAADAADAAPALCSTGDRAARTKALESPACWSSARSSACASICAGSMRGRCSGGACS